jgi:hypothetical protein
MLMCGQMTSRSRGESRSAGKDNYSLYFCTFYLSVLNPVAFISTDSLGYCQSQLIF